MLQPLGVFGASFLALIRPPLFKLWICGYARAEYKLTKIIQTN